jgi:hypothetical protein
VSKMEKFLRDRGVVWVNWCPGEPDDDLHGFVTVRERDAFEAGGAGPFRRVIRDHHRLGPVPAEILAVRQIYFRRR